ncbi:hypothetical protein SCHPADRAFT_629525 [Schizopora paradoxa]|uniref:DBF4-type domain-containing protein n=1 Tax=Schizopora paradoxa TaxID=27342 RepID=A0A0H2R7R7_9AGAM|nr:hypothetical protein SCHPADRAFT_629525 [Schizopora paradoxa]
MIHIDLNRRIYPRIIAPVVAPEVKAPTPARKALGGITNFSLKRPRPCSSSDPLSGFFAGPAHAHVVKGVSKPSKIFRDSPSLTEKENGREKGSQPRPAKRRRLTQAQEVKDDDPRIDGAMDMLEFPTWTFCFDVPISNHEGSDLQQRVLSLGGRITSFLSKEVTHFITDCPHTTRGSWIKENSAKRARTSVLRRPVHSIGEVHETGNADVDARVRKALELGLKIWDTKKLDSVLTRCGFPSQSQLYPVVDGTLANLRESERRLHGTPLEHNWIQRLPNFRYFSKNSRFVLIEDMNQKYAPIAAKEYTITKRRADSEELGSWPVPYCHPLSCCPFIPYYAKGIKQDGPIVEPVADANHLPSNQLLAPPRVIDNVGNLEIADTKAIRNEAGFREKTNIRPMDPPLCQYHWGFDPLLPAANVTWFPPARRDEIIKPKYCENCQEHFEDLKKHVQSAWHRIFAHNKRNFVELDCVLSRVRRRTREEVETEERDRREAKLFEEELQGIETFSYDEDSDADEDFDGYDSSFLYWDSDSDIDIDSDSEHESVDSEGGTLLEFNL